MAQSTSRNVSRENCLRKFVYVLVTTLLVRCSDLPDPNAYDSITTPDTKTWQIVHPCTSDGYLTTIKIVEAADG